jgi:pimeloyl-ACP methyl ester carboxylesterase
VIPAPVRVALPDITLAVTDVGEGPAVVLLHGFPDRASMWSAQIEGLVAAGYRVIAPDLRGFGDSDRPDAVDAYRISRSVADVLALLDERGVERAAVVGHDFGSVVGWALAMRSDRVTRYAALAVGHPEAFRAAGLAQRERSWYMLWFSFPGVAEDVLPADDWAPFRRWFHSGRDDELARTQIADLARPGALVAGLNWYRANIDPRTFVDETPLGLPRLTIPVLGMIGDQDVALGEPQMADSGRWLDGPFTYVPVPGADHWFPVRQATTVTDQLLAFLVR